MKKFLLILFIILIVLGSNSCSQSSNNYVDKNNDLYVIDLMHKSNEDVNNALKNQHLINGGLRNLHLIFDENKLIDLTLWTETDKKYSEHDLEKLASSLIKNVKFSSISRDIYVTTYFGDIQHDDNYFIVLLTSKTSETNKNKIEIAIEIIDPSPKYEGTLENITGPTIDFELNY